MSRLTRSAVLFAAALTAASAAHAQWYVGQTGISSLPRGIYDYAQGSSTFTNFRAITPSSGGAAGIEVVNGVTYVMTSLPDNRLNIAAPSGSTLTLIPLTAPIGNSSEGGLGYNQADGNFYSLENTPGTSAKSIWRITPGSWAAVRVGMFQGDDPSSIAFDNAGNCFVLDTRQISGGIASLLRFDVMSAPGTAIQVGQSSLGINVGSSAGMDVNQLTNELYLMTRMGTFLRIDTPLAAPSLAFIDSIQTSDTITGLAWVPSPGPLSLFALSAALIARRRR